MKKSHPLIKYEVIVEKGWIPLSDGTKLAATFYRPKSKEAFPAIFEYLPYRKDDLAISRSNKRYYYFAERGYIGVRVDVRGTGSSEGKAAENEYVLQEQLDGYEVIEWLADQEWCTGKVGMQGGSYGGFNAVQVASHNPPHLAAISPWFFADDVYTDGDHFEGGCLSAIGLGYYGMSMLTMNALPPDPQYFVGKKESWEESWSKRLDEYEPWIMEWFDHQTNDDFWRAQTLRPDYDLIKCPVFMVGGWGDHFRNAIPRMLEHLKVPKKAIIGPWVHTLPSSGLPGPNIDILYELLRWWDYWLKGEDNGVMDEPSLAVYVQRDRPPGMFADYAEGYWRYEKGWPLEEALEETYYFRPHGSLAKKPPMAASNSYDQYKYRPDVGVMGNVWFSQGNTLGEEQSLDEAFSLTYTGEPLEEDLEILGFPQIQLHASSTAKNTAFVVKLTEVSPEGQSNLLTYGVLNASHRNSHEEPEALEPGKIYKLNVEMSAISWIFKKGYRIRVSITSSHWPILWPLPEVAVNRVYTDEEHVSKLILPVVPARESLQKPALDEPSEKGEPIPDVEMEPLRKPSIKITRDVLNEETSVEVERRSGHTIISRNLKCNKREVIEARTSTLDPAISSVRAESSMELRYSNGLSVDARGTSTVSSSREEFFLHLNLHIEVNGQLYFDKTWMKHVPRQFI